MLINEPGVLDEGAYRIAWLCRETPGSPAFLCPADSGMRSRSLALRRRVALFARATSTLLRLGRCCRPEPWPSHEAFDTSTIIVPQVRSSSGPCLFREKVLAKSLSCVKMNEGCVWIAYFILFHTISRRSILHFI